MARRTAKPQAQDDDAPVMVILDDGSRHEYATIEDARADHPRALILPASEVTDDDAESA